MPESKPKKIRIYKLAAEINLSSDSLVDYLKEKGYKVKGHMTLVTDEMMADIQGHFKKDIEKAEKHYKKIEEFQRKMSEKADKDEKSVSITEEEETPEEVQTTAPEPEEEPEEFEDAAEEEAVEEEAEEQTAEEAEPVAEEAEEAEEVPEEEVAPVEEEEPEAEKVAAAESKASEKETEEEAKQSPAEKVRRGKTRDGKPKGLTVLGKMDLDADKRPKRKKPVEKATGADGKAATPPPVLDPDELAKKKKKRKKTRRKKEETTDAAGRKKTKGKKFEFDEREVEESIRRTISSMEESGSPNRASARKKKRRERSEIEEKRQEERAQEKTKIEVTEFIAVNELANLMNVQVGDVIQKFIELGLMVSINQRLDVESITLVADEFGFDVEFAEEYTAEELEDREDSEEELEPRSAVVTIMGHVDHGKTSLLDYIREANVVGGESGGITQHIGAYKVEVEPGKQVAFLDTPGHEAFTAMRARGAQATDIVVLIVAADDAVMPQTVEALNHAQAANVPIIVAINKIDKPGSNPDKIKQQLADRNVLVEDWGGKYQCVEISAKQGLHIDVLLEKILLEAELLELKANPDREARGVVIESELDKGRGITATVLVQKGTLKIQDPFVAGNFHGRVRAMFDERGKKIDEAGPSTPVLVLGLEGAPQAGDSFIVVESERAAREVALKRQQLKREQDHKQVRHITLDEISRQISIGGVKELPIIVKGDVDGSVEALADSFMKLSNEEVVVRVIHKGVGAISESDVLLADASNAIIIGFHVRPHLNARKLAESQKVDVRIYNVIYDAINEVKSALEGLLSPIIKEQILGTIEIRETFKVPKLGVIAGCYITEGRINRNNSIRLIRDGVVIYDGELASLKRFKDDVREVETGYECGLNIAGYNDIKVGDVIEAYKLVEHKKTLA